MATTPPPPPPPGSPPPPPAVASSGGSKAWVAVSVIFIILFIVAGVLAFRFALLSQSDSERVAKIQQEVTALEMEKVEKEESTMMMMEDLESLPDFYYTSGSSLTSEDCCEFDLHAVDQVTGEDTIVFSENYLQVYAVPQKNFDGRVFVTTKGDSDVASLPIQSIDVNNPVSLTDVVVLETGAVLSPDQSKIIFANGPDSDLNPDTLLSHNLLTGDLVVIGGLNEGESYFKELNLNLDVPGPSHAGFFGTWTSLSCVQVAIYEEAVFGPDEEAVPDVLMTFEEYREYCLE